MLLTFISLILNFATPDFRILACALFASAAGSVIIITSSVTIISLFRAVSEPLVRFFAMPARVSNSRLFVNLALVCNAAVALPRNSFDSLSG
jgi:hypothetical protein